MVERSRRSSGATIAACRAALQDGVAANLAGGTHHAFYERGEGFCVFNDAAVAARAIHANTIRRAQAMFVTARNSSAVNA
jgi:acetoin utilization deacetylase AcuC-like enzyme